MNVLSLFDGMSCGQIALDRSGFKVDHYFASEIEPAPIAVTMKNYPNTKQLGDVTQVKPKRQGGIDLLMGGSPCQGFSFAGKQLNFEDPRSKLFFEFVRLLEETNPKYFLLENVKMKQEYQDVISHHLGVYPIEINSELVSAQYRSRLYWTNIPVTVLPKNLNLVTEDILLDEVDSVYHLSDEYIERFNNSKGNNTRDIKFPTSGKVKIIGTTVGPNAKGTNSRHWVHDIKTKMGCLTATDYKQPKQVLDKKGVLRKLTPVEYERLQNVPDDYSECVSNTQRYKMLGNGWTVDVIAHILKGMKS